MKTASVSKLKASLSEYLRRVRAGEEVLVTERGRPIAKLTPVFGLQGLPEHLAEMEKQGLVKLGSGKLAKRFWDLPCWKKGRRAGEVLGYFSPRSLMRRGIPI
ncbi:MAG: type II toxin-antitoxin system prevent-host-death family antitoxin [Deltaproteobacteria bacterium]|nr:type II toxin-antitoxin system prevent-host-death family antitoxin [Deltaproteobacteria bacterium]